MAGDAHSKKVGNVVWVHIVYITEELLVGGSFAIFEGQKRDNLKIEMLYS